MDREIQKVMDQFGFDRLVAWRHVRDREILRRRGEDLRARNFYK